MLPKNPAFVTPESVKSSRSFFKITMIAVFAVVLVLGGWFLYQSFKNEAEPAQAPGNNQPPPIANVPSTSTPNTVIKSESALSKRLVKPEEIILEKAKTIPRIAGYDLPISSAKISNFTDFNNKVNLGSQARLILEQNGFAVFDTPSSLITSPEEFGSYYSVLTDKDIPVFVTSDSLLHYYHIFFDTALARLEKDIFYQELWNLTKSLLDDSARIYEQATEPKLKEAAKRNVAYLSVALELLKPKTNQLLTKANVKQAVNCYGPPDYCDGIYSKAIQDGSFGTFGQDDAKTFTFTVPDFAKALVQQELQLINKAEGWKCSPTFLYQEDYSQYVSRGHYTKSEKLKNYFKAVMWFGRMTDLAKGSPVLAQNKCSLHDEAGFVSEYDAEVQTLGAALMANKFASDTAIQKSWTKIYAVTSFFVGYSDDLGPLEYAQLIKPLANGTSTVDAAKIAAEIDNISQSIKEKLPQPKIYSGLGNAKMLVLFPPPLTDEQIVELKKQAENLLANTQGFRLMGQREVVDAGLFDQIVSPYSGEYRGDKTKLPFTYVLTETKREVRGFPLGLDVFALFGSTRAKEIITAQGDADYSDYEKTFNKLKAEIDSLPQGEWFKNLYWNWLYVLKGLITPYGEGYQTFMQTKAWQDKELATALASWTELRHDTTLYVKQSYTTAEMGGAPNEPIVGYVEPVSEFYARLLNLTRMTNKGLGNLLTDEEMNKVGLKGALISFDDILSRLLAISEKELDNQNLSEDDYFFIKYFGTRLEGINSGLLAASGGSGIDVDPDMFKTTLVADVHTDGNTKQVLEEGVGYIKTMAVAYKLPDDRILIGLGPVFSYYEFKQPLNNRLTDQAWRAMLKSTPPAVPEWTKSFSE